LLAHKFISSEEKRNIIFSEINQHQLKIIDFPKTFGDVFWRKEIPAEEN
jgi:hypothetical protein